MPPKNKAPSPKILAVLLVGITAFLSVFIAIQEYTLQTGSTLFLKTAPVDPRDLLRGDYVTLRYEFEDDAILQDYITQNNIQEDTPLYITFTRDEHNLGSIESVGSEIPSQEEIFLKVKTEPQSWWRNSIYTGIGKYFVPEGTGREIERIRGDMTVELKVDKFGSAKIVDLYYKGERINPKTFRAD